MIESLTIDAIQALRDELKKEREQLKESIVNNVTNPNLDLVEKGKAQLCNLLISKCESILKERK